MVNYDYIIKTLQEVKQDIVDPYTLVKLNIALDELQALVKQQNIEADSMGIMHELSILRSLERGK
jgi:hypothetical protein